MLIDNYNKSDVVPKHASFLNQLLHDWVQKSNHQSYTRVTLLCWTTMILL
jgi:hypothetical protein